MQRIDPRRVTPRTTGESRTVQLLKYHQQKVRELKAELNKERVKHE